jgi:hypothetical protein
MEVFRLEADADRYQNLALVDETEWARLNEGFGGDRMAGAWLPPKVEVDEPKLPASDFPGFSGTPVFGARAVEALRDLLDPNGELLPLDCDTGDYWAFNVTAVIDALDEQASEVKRFRDGRVMRVVRYEFVAEGVDRPVFKIPQEVKSREFCTDEFVRRVEEAGLSGFYFVPVWST